MLVLTRKTGESIVIGENIEIQVVAIDGETVRIGIKAPRELPVYRHELFQAIREENLRALRSAATVGRCLPGLLEESSGDKEKETL